ncbi:hypothetical protein PRZ01_02535 [Paucibacter sp. hw1]|uniref:Uncharacterized protein n=1 Tax=Roseateles koreensis TaxID=2987526 RepID=A0ABT5KMJ1_9BURK|nr:hypothetical protein [Roseateles koreensis]
MPLNTLSVPGSIIFSRMLPGVVRSTLLCHATPEAALSLGDKALCRLMRVASPIFTGAKFFVPVYHLLAACTAPSPGMPRAG